MLLRNKKSWLRADRASYHYKNAALVLALLAVPLGSMAQQTYPLPVNGTSPQGEERVMERNGEKTITGVTQPSITVYRPEKSNGTAVILCAGGDMEILPVVIGTNCLIKMLSKRKPYPTICNAFLGQKIDLTLVLLDEIQDKTIEE